MVMLNGFVIIDLISIISYKCSKVFEEPKLDYVLIEFHACTID